jgi:hypothetical protein
VDRFAKARGAKHCRTCCTVHRRTSIDKRRKPAGVSGEKTHGNESRREACCQGQKSGRQESGCGEARREEGRGQGQACRQESGCGQTRREEGCGQGQARREESSRQGQAGCEKGRSAHQKGQDCREEGRRQGEDCHGESHQEIRRPGVFTARPVASPPGFFVGVR